MGLRASVGTAPSSLLGRAYGTRRGHRGGAFPVSFPVPPGPLPRRRGSTRQGLPRLPGRGSGGTGKELGGFVRGSAIRNKSGPIPVPGAVSEICLVSILGRAMRALVSSPFF